VNLLGCIRSIRRRVASYKERAAEPHERARHELVEHELRKIEHVLEGATDQADMPLTARLHALLDAAQLARQRCRTDRHLDPLELWMDSDQGLRELLINAERVP
jgi:hypothetical protein